ncbi:MAG: ferredoxin-thioredoxin reductase catalytic domain-containing protein [Anaerolineae bacterium]|nr:ferredoxin:glutaredoxin reductase [Anaerolineae bacterium]MCX8066438.1 ferredoxin:glutaredoxin reductase [Anaerolineae bacterium]MDW7991587.1 ferredoxin-thioredoxin reductase catalytic domain-containing protein [Anaerolineae bacterium]
MNQISREEVEALYQRLYEEAEASGYHLNPDKEFTLALVEGLLVNEARYGYWACPCRLATGIKEKDLDIICPCDYRDADLLEWGTCYCGLYVSEEVLRGEQPLQPIPERRPPEGQRPQEQPARPPAVSVTQLPLPVWRCRVCGYLCAREQPPAVCPICKAKRDRFERFL